MNQWDPEWVCPFCHLKREIAAGPDPCLGWLPGVDYACCGHGGVKHEGGIGGYIKFTNGATIRFTHLTEVEGLYDNHLETCR